MTDLEVLFAVRSLLACPERWIKGPLACNIEGRKVSVTHPHACKFSLDGAFYRVQYITKARCGPVYEKVRRLACGQGSIPLSSFNNALGTNLYIVLGILDQAIRLLGGTPPQEEVEE